MVAGLQCATPLWKRHFYYIKRPLSNLILTGLYDITYAANKPPCIKSNENVRILDTNSSSTLYHFLYWNYKCFWSSSNHMELKTQVWLEKNHIPYVCLFTLVQIGPFFVHFSSTFTLIWSISGLLLSQKYAHEWINHVRACRI